MRSLRRTVAVAALGISVVCQAKTDADYRPLASWSDPALAAYARWETDLQRRVEANRSVRGDHRAARAGIRPKSVELLADNVLRRHPRLLQGSPARARAVLLRRIQHGDVPRLRGYMAEAMFVDRNADWGYVSKPNATQFDVYRWRAGERAPFGGQIKYHDSGAAAMYAKDMLSDHRAPRFFIPDDHVRNLKEHLLSQATGLQAGGDERGAAARFRDYGRVYPIGATSTEIRSATTEVGHSLAAERYATYTSFGAAAALAVGPMLSEAAAGNLSREVVIHQGLRALSITGSGLAADKLLARIGEGSFRGGVRGNVIVGSAIAMTEIAWLLQEQGWRGAFYEPKFYEETMGGVSAVGLGLAGGTLATIFSGETGFAAPIIGLGAGFLAGSVGYLGGKHATRVVLDVVKPEFLRRQERQRIEQIKAALDRAICAEQERPFSYEKAI